MIITDIGTSRFAKHEKVDVTLPRTGLVLVTGANGHGKSTLPEAVAQGIWNKSIRALPGWRVDGKSGVKITFEGGHVLRHVSKSKHDLKWRAGDAGAGDFPTRTKSQTELESHVGTFHVWRHACVFHTKDASVFTEATDAERKRLLEDVLELSRVEKAYRNAAKELSRERIALTAAHHRVEMATAELDRYTAEKVLVEAELEDVPDLEAMRTTGKELRRMYDEQKEHVETLRTSERQGREAVAGAQHEVQRIKNRITKLAALEGDCDECERPVSRDHCKKQVLAARSWLALAKRELDQLQLQAQVETDAVNSAAVELEEHQTAYQTNVADGRAAVAAQKRNDERAAKVDGVDDKIEAAQAAVVAATALATETAKDLNELEAASSVLSYQGVRASLLSAAVTALQDLANEWLNRLGLAGLEVVLSSQSKSKKGAVSDKISFELKGAGGGLGYGAASTGEQRRVDIAMLLAIGELAGSSRGLSPGSTMFVDELFDGLDEEGVAAVVTMLRELSTERCVVVITHSARLITSLAPDLCLVAENGSIAGK